MVKAAQPRSETVYQNGGVVVEKDVPVKLAVALPGIKQHPDVLEAVQQPAVNHASLFHV